MHFINTFNLLIAIGATAAMAAPSFPSLNGLTARGGGGGGQTCAGDQSYVGWEKSCKCPSGCDFDDAVSKCHYPTHAPLVCAYGQISWCARSATDYCKYDDKDERCWKDGRSLIFCAPEGEVEKTLPEVCPPAHPECAGDQHWDYAAKQCVCETGKVFANGKCGYPPLSPPICTYGEKGYCAKDKDNYCLYDATNVICLADGYNTVFCSSPPKIKDTCAEKWDH